MRYLWLALVLTACAADSEPRECELPTRVVATRTELSGNCGPVPKQVSTPADDSELPEGCTLDADHAACFVSGLLECEDGTKRQWWIDGKSGRWVGEDFIHTPQCESRYRLELEVR